MFDTFSVCRKDDNSEVNVMMIDKMLREHFQLRTNEQDLPYGHFFFTGKDESMGISQISISWAGLIHCVVYYSEINGGRRSTYDMVAALSWIKWAGIGFPDSTVDFLSKMMDYLDQKGYYVYVNRYIRYDIEDILRCVAEEAAKSSRRAFDFLVKVVDRLEKQREYEVLHELKELLVDREEKLHSY